VPGATKRPKELLGADSNRNAADLDVISTCPVLIGVDPGPGGEAGTLVDGGAAGITPCLA
jgi:hypothetical protein